MNHVQSWKQAKGKLPGNANPLLGHRFGADPYALVFDGRVYLYMTGDKLEHDADGVPQKNSYQSINRIAVISSEDLVNWKDHGDIRVAGPEGAATWASQSWAPAAVHKVVDGQDRFFLYFANNATSIGVLVADSPAGPWHDPIGKALITRQTPGVEDVTWLFDPAVLVDDDGKGYIYFGGGVPEGRYDWPDTARVMELTDDMTGVTGRALTIKAPYMFEDAGIHKYEGTYMFTYCSNFYSGERAEGSPPAGEIAYMTSDKPMGPWQYQGTILKNPGHFFGVSGNNHHAIFRFGDDWYIAYHAQTLSQAMDIPDGYRSTHLNKVFFNEDGSIRDVQADYAGVGQLKPFDPYRHASAVMAWSAGIRTEPAPASASGGPAAGETVITAFEDGGWFAVAGADFGAGGPSAFTVSALGGTAEVRLDIRLNRPDGPLAGGLAIPAAAEPGQWRELNAEMTGIEGSHDIYFVISGLSGADEVKVGNWTFSH